MDFLTSTESCWLVCGCQEQACDCCPFVMRWNYLNICSIQAFCISSIYKIANTSFKEVFHSGQICTKMPDREVFSIVSLHLLLFTEGLNSLFKRIANMLLSGCGQQCCLSSDPEVQSSLSETRNWDFRRCIPQHKVRGREVLQGLAKCHKMVQIQLLR